jgi:uncharacterized protein YuzE
VERFDRDRASYSSGRYNEARVDSINPLLGWDVENRQGRPEVYRDVVYEARVKVGGGTIKLHPQEGQAGVKFDYYPETDSLYIELNPGRERKPGGTQEVVGWGDHDIVIDVDGVPVGIDIGSFASHIVDITKLEVEGPIFGLIPSEGSERRVS